MKNTDLTFFTNEHGHTLLDRFSNNVITTGDAHNKSKQSMNLICY